VASAGNGHALALAARELAGHAAGQMRDAQQLDRLLQRPGSTGLIDAPDAIFKIALDIQMVEQAGLLKDVAQVALPGGHKQAARAVLPDTSGHHHPPAGALEPSDAPQQRGFARARGPKDHGDAARRQAQLDL
jgi:hypothetical protein